MNKVLLSATLLSSLVLVACNPSNNNAAPAASSTGASAASQPVSLSCEHPDLNQQTRQRIEKIISESQAIRDNIRHLIDTNKISATLAQLDIQVNQVQAANNVCQAQLHIQIPTDIWQLMQDNAPLLAISPEEILSGVVANAQGQWQNGILTAPLQFTLNNGVPEFPDNELSDIARALGATLVASSVKDTVVINGKTMSRQKALAQLHGITNEPSPQAASVPSVPLAKEVEPIGDAVPAPPTPEEMQQQSNSLNNTAPTQPAPQTLTPAAEPAKSRVNERDLDSARAANSDADQAIKGAWRKISPDIQKDLVNEQRDWERKKATACRNVAAKGADASESQYLQMQCDTRLTRERVQYLNGYSIE